MYSENQTSIEYPNSYNAIPDVEEQKFRPQTTTQHEIEEIDDQLKNGRNIRYIIWLYLQTIALIVLIINPLKSPYDTPTKISIAMFSTAILFSFIMIIANHKKSSPIATFSLVLMTIFAFPLAYYAAIFVEAYVNEWQSVDNEGALIVDKKLYYAVFSCVALILHVGFNVVGGANVRHTFAQREELVKEMYKYSY